MNNTSPARLAGRVFFLSVLVVALFAPAIVLAQSDNATCFDCHDDKDMTDDNGRFIGVPKAWFDASAHADLECVDCHSQPGDFEDVPHWKSYTKVDCADCHEDESHSFELNFHARARERGNLSAPTCADCHGIGGSPHRLRALDTRTAEQACQTCHSTEAKAFDSGVHAQAAKAGKKSPGCVTCHQSHGPGLPPAAGAVSKLCTTCHTDAMESVERGGHFQIGEETTDQLNCVSCHDAHATMKPELSERVEQKCQTCHKEERQAFVGSVHEDLVADGGMNCVSCHATHLAEGDTIQLDAGCAVCHEDEEAEYRNSAHRLGRMRGAHAASCADCHNGHHILPASDPSSTINPKNIPHTCSQCHADEPTVTAEFVRLPLNVPSYLESVHGRAYRDSAVVNDRWNHGHAATCTDCHGTHDLRSAEDRQSTINHYNIASTCGRCHTDIEARYSQSVHGKAVALGLKEAPTCTDCHNEHLIQNPADPDSPLSAVHRAKELCGNCHTDPKIIHKYGMARGVVESYLDSYHGWAIDRGSPLVATCTDCHNVHEIRSPLDPKSSVFPANVTATCRKCHTGSNPTFAQSYTHAAALKAKGYDDYARYVYIFLIIVVLGGMAAHNFIIARHEYRRIAKHRLSEPYIQRWHQAERYQHMALFISFALLAVTGFALRFPNSWWVHVIGLATHESLRANLHRAMAVVMTAVSIYHIVWIIATRRGRWALKEMAPRYWDVTQVFQNVAYHLGKRKERPAFRVFDYTQKAEYWALVWGTLVMVLTGLILWFPTFATQYMPAWAVRVSEVVHFYEAILAVGAIVIWHWFFVIFLPQEYPMSTVWLNGRYPAREWKEFHRGEFEQVGGSAIRHPGSDRRGELEPEDMVTSAPGPENNNAPNGSEKKGKSEK